MRRGSPTLLGFARGGVPRRGRGVGAEGPGLSRAPPTPRFPPALPQVCTRASGTLDPSWWGDWHFGPRLCPWAPRGSSHPPPTAPTMVSIRGPAPRCCCFPGPAGVSARSPDPRPASANLRLRHLPEMLCSSTTNFPDYRHPWAFGDIVSSLLPLGGRLGCWGPPGRGSCSPEGPLGAGLRLEPAVWGAPWCRELKVHRGLPTWSGGRKARGDPAHRSGRHPFSGPFQRQPVT